MPVHTNLNPDHEDIRILDVVRDVEISNDQGVFNVACAKIARSGAVAEHLVFYKELISPLPLRIQSGCALGHIFGDNECDCRVQFQKALAYIERRNQGMVIYSPSHDGRGRGLFSKLSVYKHRQDQGVDSQTACQTLGVPYDTRDYREFALLLRHFGIRDVVLLGSSSRKEAALKSCGMGVVDQVAL